MQPLSFPSDIPTTPPVNSKPRLIASWGRITGLATLVTAALWFKLACNLWVQIERPRVIGVMAVLSATLAALTLLPTLVARRRVRVPAVVASLGGILAYAAVVASIVLVGLTVFFVNPRTAPVQWQGLAGAMCALLVVFFARRSAADRAITLQLLAGLGLVVWAIPLLLLPITLYGALTDHATLSSDPAPLSGPPAPGAPRRIVLVTFDALRGRSTSMRDPKADRTPQLARFARTATYFPQFRAASDFTTNSLPAILSGIGPRVYMRGVKSEGAMVREAYLTGVAAHLAPAGYSAYFATMGVSPAILGFGQEFDDGFSNGWFFDPAMFNTHSYLPVRETFDWLGLHLTGHGNRLTASGVSNPLLVRQTFQHAVELVASHPDSSFTWIHLGAPHAPYFDIPASDVGKQLKPRYPYIDDQHVLDASAAERKHIDQVYEHYVRFADGEFGLFQQAMEARGLWRDSLIIVTSDHGEDLSHLGMWGHANGLITESVARVPLLVHLPGQTTARQDDRLCTHIDLLPTILDRVYGRAPAGLKGQDLLAPPVPDRLVYTWGLRYRHFGRPTYPATLAAYRGGYKYLLSAGAGNLPREQLFDLTRDPAATHDEAARHPDLVAAFRKRATRDVGFDLQGLRP